MRNITVSIADETYKRARIVAAERDTSISALVKAYLEQLAADESASERLKRQEREVRKLISNFSASSRLSRDQVHERSS